MARDDKSRQIDRNISVNFAAGSRSDQQLKAKLQRILTSDDRFDNKSDLGKHYIRKGLEAEEQGLANPPEGSPVNEELTILLKTIQQQLSEIRRSDSSVDTISSLLRDIDHRTRTLRPAFAAGVAMLLVQLDWDEDQAADWARKHLLPSSNSGEPPGGNP